MSEQSVEVRAGRFMGAAVVWLMGLIMRVCGIVVAYQYFGLEMVGMIFLLSLGHAFMSSGWKEMESL